MTNTNCIIVASYLKQRTTVTTHTIGVTMVNVKRFDDDEVESTETIRQQPYHTMVAQQLQQYTSVSKSLI